MSSVWDYAIKRKNVLKKVLEGQCKRCNKVITCSGNSTTTLKNHLKTHGIDMEKPTVSASKEDTISEKRTKSISDFLVKKSLKEIVSDLATDGITIRAITRNNYIRQSITRDGLKLPINERDVMKLIIEDFLEKKAKMITLVKQKIDSGTKFSMTVDEYTTIRGRRFFGVNIHTSDDKMTMKTGLVRIFGSCTAEVMINAMKEHLADFGIDMNKDIVGSTQDGAAINKKFIQLLDIIGQFCLNHAIHLGVCDTLYKKKSIDEEKSYWNNDEIEDTECYDDCLGLSNDIDIENVDLNYHDLLQTSRKLVKFIKNSTVRNNVFLTKNKALTGRNSELYLDIKTRWNSIPTMLDSIIKSELAIRETLTEFNAIYQIDSVDFDALNNLLCAMEPIKLAVERLSQDDATLVSAEIILEFMFKKLLMINSEISQDLHDNLKQRIDERINKDVMNLLKSLKDSSVVPSETTLTFAGRLASRIFEFDDGDDIRGSTQEEFENTNLSLKEELNMLLYMDQTPKVLGVDFKWLKSEFTLYKNTGQRTENLQKLYNALLSIKPTSTDIERVFSICTNFCTKIRSRLSDDALKALVFLKFYYKK